MSPDSGLVSRCGASAAASCIFLQHTLPLFVCSHLLTWPLSLPVTNTLHGILGSPMGTLLPISEEDIVQEQTHLPGSSPLQENLYLGKELTRPECLSWLENGTHGKEEPSCTQRESSQAAVPRRLQNRLARAKPHEPWSGLMQVQLPPQTVWSRMHVQREPTLTLRGCLAWNPAACLLGHPQDDC